MRPTAMRCVTTTLLLLLWMAMPAGVAAAYPDTIALPDDFAPEGIAVGRGHTFFTGSLSGQGIWRGDLRTGSGDPLVIGGGPFVGMKVDARNRLWVAGGPTGGGWIFDGSTGDTLATLSFASPPTFINDVVVTRTAAYFTDSWRPAIYRVAIDAGGAFGDPEEIALDPAEIEFDSTPFTFNLNGIDATQDGGTLIVVNSTAGSLYTVDPTSGEAVGIDLGLASVGFGDGILLHGRTLYVVRNQLDVVAVVSLSPDLGSGQVINEITSDGFDVPTTVARFGSSLYVVNARFMRVDPDPPPDPYWVTRIDR